MKKGWQTKKLGDVCDFEGGSQPPKSEFIYDEKPGYVRFLQIRDFGSDKNVTYIRHSKKNRLCTENDILIGRYGASVGKILTDKAGAYNVALMKTIPNLEVLDQSWFYHFLISDEFQKPLLNVADRSAQAGFSKDDIYNFPVPVPPLAEQQRIVGLLDEAFEGLATAKANAEKNLQNARALFESHLQSVFTQRGKGWVERKLGDVCDFVGGSQPPKAVFSQVKKPDSIRLIQIRDYKSDKHIVYIPKSQARRFCAANDIMIGRYGPPIFQILRGLDGAYNVALMKAVPDEAQVNREFLFYFLKHPAILEYVIYHSERAAGQIGVTKETLAPYPIALPSLAEQASVAATIDSLAAETQRLARLYEQKLAALEALKKSLLHQAFSGEL
jgi:type I restriction enzyme S subunit